MLLAGEKQSLAGRARRRMHPIHFYEGRNGAGKSLAAVYDTLPTLDAGRPVLSTVRFLDYAAPRPCEGWRSAITEGWRQSTSKGMPDFHRVDCDDPGHGEPGHMQAHPLFIPFTQWEQLLAWSFGDVVMDEITGVADSNESARLPEAVANFLAQMRRADVAVRITGLGWMRANKRLREAVVAVTRCKSTLPAPAPKNLDGTERIWRPRRLAKWVTYDARELPLDDISATAWESATVLVRSRHWIPDSPALAAYDTYSPVLAVGTVTDAGRCAHCGGTRKASECACPDYLDRKERQREFLELRRPPSRRPSAAGR